MKYNLIFGHKTPDTDSVCSAITLSHLKNKLNESSSFFTASREKLVRMIFEEDVYQGIYIDKCVSRKKQIVPKVINALNQLK